MGGRTLKYAAVVADEEVPDALPPVGEALDAAFAVQRSALRRIEQSQRELRGSVGELRGSVGELQASQRELQGSVGELQASQREIAEVLTGHSEILLGIAEKVDKLSSG